MYCLLDVASGGRALIWSRVDDALVYHVKFTAMNSLSEWARVLGTCRCGGVCHFRRPGVRYPDMYSLSM